MSVIKLTSDNFDSVTKNPDKPVLVDFWAPWCGPCKMMGPIIEELSGQMDDVVFAKVNVDEEPALAIGYGVASIPTLILFENGAQVDKMVGFRPKESVVEFLGK